MEEKTKDDSEIITRAIKEMEEEGTLYKADGKPNIPLLMEKTGLTRQRARSLAKKDFKNVPHGNIGKEREKALNAEESAVVDSLLSKGETNSTVLMRELKDRFGYTGSISSVKRYKYAHQYLVPAPRITVSLQGQRINRYETGPGVMFQMDWGFVNVNCIDGSVVRVAAFAMVCHHCGKIFVEFFPNSRQHNLFIGMSSSATSVIDRLSQQPESMQSPLPTGNKLIRVLISIQFMLQQLSRQIHIFQLL